MAFAPCEIMVVVHVVGYGATNDPMHALDHPVSPGIGIAPCKRHGGEVALTEFAIPVDDGWRDVDALSTACGFQISACRRVPEATAAEMHADPNKAVLIEHQIDIVVAGPNGAELSPRLVLVVSHTRRQPCPIVIEQFVIDALGVLAADAE